MKCLNCFKERVGRSLYCSAKCKVAWNRNRKRNTKALIENVTVTSVTASDNRNIGFNPDGSIPAVMIGEPGMPTATEVALGINPRPATNPDVQAIWDKRNAQGQASLYGGWPDRTKTKAI